MRNCWGLPPKELDKVDERDRDCVYCRITLTTPFRYRDTDRTIEHFHHRAGYEEPLNDPAVVGMACYRCNCKERKSLPLRVWFETEYCKSRNINAQTVAEPVKRFLANGGP